MSAIWSDWETWLEPSHWDDPGLTEVFLSSTIYGCTVTIKSYPTFRVPKVKPRYAVTELVIQ